MRQERGELRERLEQELGDLRFERQGQVMEHVRRQGFLSRVRELWNKEIELPVLPLGLACVIIVALTLAERLDVTETANPAQLEQGQQRELVEAGGNTYWKDDYERAVAAIADPD